MYLKERWCKSMKLIDANVILRYLLGDNEAMMLTAREVIEAGACVTTEVLAEVVYVLKGVYKAERDEIAEWVDEFLSEVVIENKQAVRYALKVYAETSLDFVDCVLIGYNRILGREVFSFDKKLNRLLIKE